MGKDSYARRSEEQTIPGSKQKLIARLPCCRSTAIDNSYHIRQRREEDRRCPRGSLLHAFEDHKNACQYVGSLITWYVQIRSKAWTKTIVALRMQDDISHLTKKRQPAHTHIFTMNRGNTTRRRNISLQALTRRSMASSITRFSAVTLRVQPATGHAASVFFVPAILMWLRMAPFSNV